MLVILPYFFSIIPTLVQAGDFICQWNGAIGCRPQTVNCDSGESVDPNFCMQWRTPDECRGKRANCVQGPIPATRCESAAGVCRPVCGLGEYNAGGSLVCQNSGDICCRGVTTSAETNTAAFCNFDLRQGVDTAIGCLMAGNPQQFVSQLIGWGVGVGGGIAFLLIVYAGFMITTASGDPKRVQAGRELLFSAISGLVLIVLAVILLNFIGVSVLGLNSLGFSTP